MPERIGTGTCHQGRGKDNRIRLWDVKAGKERAALTGHTGGAISVAFSPDSQTLASVRKDETIKL
jgi:WD40 repeat protein